MFTGELDSNQNQKFESVGTLDIETNGFDGAQNELVGIALGYYEPEYDTAEIEVISRGKIPDEEALIRSAYSWLNRRSPDSLATYNGTEFDFVFLNDRIETLGLSPPPTLDCISQHVDLFTPRKRVANQSNRKWPTLEESLATYEIPVHLTEWEGGELNNTRFGEDFAPKYLTAIDQGNKSAISRLENTLLEYAASDAEATLALYAADSGNEYIPTYSY